MEATGGFEPPNKGFADLSLNHLGTSPLRAGFYRSRSGATSPLGTLRVAPTPRVTARPSPRALPRGPRIVSNQPRDHSLDCDVPGIHGHGTHRGIGRLQSHARALCVIPF